MPTVLSGEALVAARCYDAHVAEVAAKIIE